MAATARIAAEHGLFKCIRQTTTIYTQSNTRFFGPTRNGHQTASRSFHPFVCRAHACD